MIHGYSRAMFFQTASQRIKQMAWYTISPKLAESLMAMAPCSLALILFSCSLLAGVTLNKTQNFQSNCVPANVVSHWNLNPCNMKEDILCGKDRITYPLHSPALLSGWILPNFPNMDQWNDVSSCLMFFHLSSPDAVDVGHVDSVVVQPSGELEALEWMRGAIEWMLRYVKIHRSSTSTWNQFHLKSILDLTWFCTLLLVKSESWNQISDWNQNELNYSSFEFFVTWLPFTKPLPICCVFAFEPGGCPCRRRGWWEDKPQPGKPHFCRPSKRRALIAFSWAFRASRMCVLRRWQAGDGWLTWRSHSSDFA